MGEDRWSEEERRYWNQDRQRMRSRDDDWRGEHGGMSADYGRGAHNDRGASSQGRFDADHDRDGGRSAASQERYSSGRDGRGSDEYRQDTGWRREPGQYGGNGSGGYGAGPHRSGHYGSGFAGNQRQGRAFEGSMPRDYAGGYGNRDYRGQGQDDRNWLDKAGDEVASWFGDDEASRRRDIDKGHSGKGPKGYVRSDDRIRDDINDRLTYDRHIDASHISVEVKDGEVTLSGTITSRMDKRHAEDLAEDISGVKHVQNNLRVADAARSSESVTQAGERSNSTTGSYVASGGVAAGLGGSTASPNGNATPRSQ